MIKVSAAQGLLFGILFSFYAFGLYVGGRLRWEGVKNGDREYNSGSILGVMFSIIFGAFNIGAAMPHMKSIMEGRIAGNLAYETIDAKVDVDPTKPGKPVGKVEG